MEDEAPPRELEMDSPYTTTNENDVNDKEDYSDDEFESSYGDDDAFESDEDD